MTPKPVLFLVLSGTGTGYVPDDTTLDYKLSGFIQFAGFSGSPRSVIRYSNLTNYRSYSAGDAKVVQVFLDGQSQAEGVIKFYASRTTQPLPVYAFNFRNNSYFYYGPFTAAGGILNSISFPSQSIWY
jgi:hypothetical protein